MYWWNKESFWSNFFKDRYNAFYLMSVNTDNSSRRKRLSHLRADEINSLDWDRISTKIKTKRKIL